MADMENYDEAAEEIKNRRKKRALKVFITEGLMVLAVILLVVLTTMIATGYNVKPGKDWKIERTGLVQLQSSPTGANITIDGETIFGWTNMSRSMTEGEHEIILSREGYETWSKKIFVMAGLYYRLDYPRLFLTEKKVEEVETIPEGFNLSFAKDGNIALAYSNEATTWKVLEVDADKSKSKEISTKDLFTPLSEGESDSGVKIEAWSGNSEKVLISRNNEWALVNVKQPEKSVNLTKKYGMNFSQMKIANDAANVLYAVSDGNLRKIEVNEEKISSVLVKNLKTFDNSKLDFVYVADEDGDGETEIGIYRDGEKTLLKLEFNTEEDGGEIEKQNEDKDFLALLRKIKEVGYSEYYGEFYLNVIFDDGRWAIFRGGRADFSDSESKLVLFEKNGKEPRRFEIRGDGEFFVLDFDDEERVFDVEAGNVVKITTFLDAKWLDEYMIYEISPEGELSVADFDRENLRKMTDGVKSGTEVKISKNNRWMYFVSSENRLSRIIIAN